MPTNIDTNMVQKLMCEGAQLVEVLPAKVYAEVHLPGAVNIPLPHLNRANSARLRQDRPVIVYCQDAL
jgi:rhodanese-related sulfurtransferase